MILLKTSLRLPLPSSNISTKKTPLILHWTSSVKTGTEITGCKDSLIFLLNFFFFSKLANSNVWLCIQHVRGWLLKVAIAKKIKNGGGDDQEVIWGRAGSLQRPLVAAWRSRSPASRPARPRPAGAVSAAPSAPGHTASKEETSATAALPEKKWNKQQLRRGSWPHPPRRGRRAPLRPRCAWPPNPWWPPRRRHTCRS